MVDGALGATTLLSDRMRWISRPTEDGFTTEFAEGTEQETEMEGLVMVALLARGEGNWPAIALRWKLAGRVLALDCVPQAIPRFGLGHPLSWLLGSRELQSSEHRLKPMPP